VAHRVVLFFMVVLWVSGCAGSPAPVVQDKPVTVVVPFTVVVPQTVVVRETVEMRITVPVTVVVTATPEPTATIVSTPTPDIAGIPPRGKYKHGYKITEEFDRFKGNTVVALDTRPAEYSRGPGSLSVLYAYKGNTPVVPSEVYFRLVSEADDWQYLKCHMLTLLLDDQISMEPKTEHDGSVGNGYVLEFVMSALSVDEFLQIVNAKKVEGKLCNTEFVLSKEQMEALRDIASRMQPG
jgi:hypothetical protein